MLNKVQLIGRLGADPTMRETSGGAQVCEMSLATSESWTDKSGERKEQTEWHRIILWNRQAEIAVKHLQKGSAIYVEGKIQTRKWTDEKTGVERYTTEIIAQRFNFLPSSGGGGGGRSGGGEVSEGATGETFNDAEIPF